MRLDNGTVVQQSLCDGVRYCSDDCISEMDPFLKIEVQR